MGRRGINGCRVMGGGEKTDQKDGGR